MHKYKLYLTVYLISNEQIIQTCSLRKKIETIYYYYNYIIIIIVITIIIIIIIIIAN